MNHALRRVSLVCLGMFLVLLVNVNFLQVFRVNSIAAEPGNIRVTVQQEKVQRGEIIAAGGPGAQQVIAVSRQISGGVYQRYYPDSFTYAPVTGYQSVFGTTTPAGLAGIEKYENAYLAGTAPSLAIHNLRGLFTGKSKQGASVYLTISPKAQAAAYAALKAFGHPAGAVALDPRTGAILAMASYPSFDPNKLTVLNSATFDKAFAALHPNSGSSPLVNRAINDLFPPGSSFKIVTSSTAFSTNVVNNPNSTIPAPQFYRLPGSTHVLTNDYNSPCGNGNPPIIFAFTVSCNTAFGKLGARLSPTDLHEFANRYGFNNPNLTVPLPVTPSNYPVETDPAFRALSAIGQHNDLVTPLQEAMMAATVAHGGVLMRPYLVQEIRAPDQSTVYSASPTPMGQVITPQVASYMSMMMESVTHNPNGTAYGAVGPQITSIDIRGKTGTAQNGVNNSHLDDSVFTCFVTGTANSPPIAVGIIVKGGGFGAATAAPIALQIIRAYLGRQ
jgi:peptidoglycan glycosyltransferase